MTTSMNFSLGGSLQADLQGQTGVYLDAFDSAGGLRASTTMISDDVEEPAVSMCPREVSGRGDRPAICG